MNEPAKPQRPIQNRPPRLRPRDAATLIIVDRAEGEPRVLMGKRHAGHRFMPDKFVFPGGALEPGDRRMSVAGPLSEAVEAKLLARVRRPTSARARALALAAIRETFEETGLAIGVADVGAPQNPPPGAWARFAATGIYPALDGLDLLARAITPPGRTKRFDARFFVVEASAIAHRVDGVVHPGAELVELVWTPLKAAQDLDLPDITRRVLKDLEDLLKGRADPWRPRPFYRRVGKAFVREEL
jgi:8-oxo-dGTP pyrophosphatase MutT (NUDIX family)